MTPTTKAGGALLDASAGNTYGPDDRELFADDIAAIEREAAQQERERIRAAIDLDRVIERHECRDNDMGIPCAFHAHLDAILADKQPIATPCQLDPDGYCVIHATGDWHTPQAAEAAGREAAGEMEPNPDQGQPSVTPSAAVAPLDVEALAALRWALDALGPRPPGAGLLYEREYEKAEAAYADAIRSSGSRNPSGGGA